MVMNTTGSVVSIRSYERIVLGRSGVTGPTGTCCHTSVVDVVVVLVVVVLAVVVGADVVVVAASVVVVRWQRPSDGADAGAVGAAPSEVCGRRRAEATGDTAAPAKRHIQ
jgi:hypothetical protein